MRMFLYIFFTPNLTAAYARYSCDNQREESIEGQLRECKAYLAQKGYLLVGEYIDRAYTGRNDARPDFQRMLADSGRKLFDVVLVWKLDRFARNKEDSAINKALLRRNGVKVESATEAISDGPEGILIETVLEGMAQFYSADLAQKVTRGLTENALKAKVNGGHCPLGLFVDSDKHYQLDPVTAPLVLEIYERYADGQTAKEICDPFNARGVLSSRDERFNKNSLWQLLQNRKYIGEFVYGDIVIPDVITPIVPLDLYERVQERKARNCRASAHSKAKVDYLLAGKLFCARRGGQMVGESGTSKTRVVHHYYKCRNTKITKTCKKRAVRKQYIEDAVVLSTYAKILKNDSVIAQIANELDKVQRRENVVVPALEQRLHDTQRRIDNLIKAIEEGLLTSSAKARLDALEQAKSDTEQAIAQEKREHVLIPKERIVAWIASFRSGDVSDPAYRKHLVNHFVNSVYVGDDGLTITWNYKDSTQTIDFKTIQSSDFARAVSPKKEPHQKAPLAF